MRSKVSMFFGIHTSEWDVVYYIQPIFLHVKFLCVKHSAFRPSLFILLFCTFFFEIELNHLWQIRNEEQKFKSNKFPIFEMICNHPPLFNIQTDKNNISKFFFPFMFRTRIARLRSSGDISWDHHVTKSFVLHYRPRWPLHNFRITEFDKNYISIFPFIFRFYIKFPF